MEESIAPEQTSRVFVGNLAYDIKWPQLKDFMQEAGNVVFADVLTLPNGYSKGCGIVEYSNPDEAQNAITLMSNRELSGRLIFVREDRENELKFAPSNKGRSRGTQLFVGNLPYSASWQDLKDLFRRAGRVTHADVAYLPDGRSRGHGIVSFENERDASNAIRLFNHYSWNGRNIEVREDRHAAGGNISSHSARRDSFNNSSSHGDSYNNSSRGSIPRGPAASNLKSTKLTSGVLPNGEPSETIFVGNLPWSTSNEDLVELFQTVGTVENAEIQFEYSGRSNGTGVVKFASLEDADNAISKLDGYNYGNRPLRISYAEYVDNN